MKSVLLNKATCRWVGKGKMRRCQCSGKFAKKSRCGKR